MESVLSLPNCPSCGKSIEPRHLRMPSGHAESIAALFHRGTSLKPLDLNKPALMQAHFKPENLALAAPANVARTDTAPGPEMPAYALEHDVRLLDQPSGRLDRRALGTVLRFSAGLDITDTSDMQRIERFTASGGNLGTASLRVCVGDIPGLMPGVHSYDPLGHRLIQLGAEVAAVGAAPFDAAQWVWLIVVDDVAKGCKKYSGRGYQYSLLDAGLLLGRILKLCDAMGLRAAASWEFDDRQLLCDLALDPSGWDVVALIALSEQPV